MRVWLALALALGLSGCAAFRSYDRSLSSTVDQAASGHVDEAIHLLDAANPGPFKDLLYYLEMGMLQRLGRHYPESQKAWSVAAQRILGGPASTTESIGSALRGASSFLVNDRLRNYPGYDYEKTLLLAHIALNRLAMGEWGEARVAIRQTHELEAVIAEERAKQYERVEADARQRGARTSVKELNGYPVQTIDNPEVNALRNSYQSALAHYLAGFVYEALGEPSLAAPGYRLANELQPGQPLLEEALRGLDERSVAAPDGLTDVLFVVGSGSAPALRSQQFNLPVSTPRGLILIALAFPVMSPVEFASPPSSLSVDGARTLALAPITSVDLMARRRLKDDMPEIMLRATVRAASRVALQAGLQQQGGGNDRNAAVVGALAALAVGMGSLVVEQADERTWRTLPSLVSIARARLPAGTHTISLWTPAGERSAPVTISGRYAVVDLRLLRNRLFVSVPAVQGPSTGVVPGALNLDSQPKEAKP